MWILPNNHPLSSVYAPEYVESKEDLKEYFEKLEPVLMWKSKPLSWKTFLLQWKRVWWLQHLSGRILKPSIRNRFEDSLMELLADTLVSHFPWLVTEQEKMTHVTCGPSFENTSELLNPDGVSLRMSQVTLHSGSTWLNVNWKKWTTSLRQEYTQRKKLALLNGGKDCSSSQLGWPTPQSRDFRSLDLPESGNYQRKEEKGWTIDLNSKVLNWATPATTQQGEISPERAKELGWVWKGTAYYTADGMKKNTSLTHQALNWPTPDCSDRRSAKSKQQGLSNAAKNWPTPTTMDQLPPKTDKAIDKEMNETRPGRSSFSNMRDAAVYGEMKNWPTPATRDYKGANSQEHFDSKERPHLSQLPNAVVMNTDFPQVKEFISTNGKSPARLNPAWSIQLMGTTLQRIFTVPLATQWSNKPPNLPSGTCGEKQKSGTNLLTDDWNDWVDN